MKLSTILNYIEDGDYQSLDRFVDTYFNGNYEVLFNLLNKQNLLEKYSEFFEEEMFTKWANYMYGEDPQYIIDFIVKTYFGDVIQGSDGYWMNIDKEDLSNLFATGRWSNDGARGVAKIILSDDIFDFFNFVDINNLYDEVISNLDKNNILKLKESVFNEVEGKEVEIDGETDIVTRDQIMDMDENDLSDFIKENAPEVNSNLASLYNSSYESAYYDEVYDLVYRELKYFFGVENLFRDYTVTRKVLDKQTKTIKEIEVPAYQVNVTKILPTVIKNVLEWDGYDSDNDFEYYGNFEGLLNRWANEANPIDFHVPEYADWNKVNENLNDMFNDYI